jgi:DNA-binding GntR family transcriptional regulator
MARDASGKDGYDVGRLQSLIESGRSRHETAQDLVLEVLRQAILENVLPPGARLRQEDLAVAFRTSRIPVREALRALEYEGLARSVPHRGFTVTALDGDEIEEIYELRAVLEAHAIRLALPLLTPRDLAELEELYREMEAVETPDEKLARRDRFYLRLYGVTARPRLVGLIARLHQEVARSLRWHLIEHSPSHGVFFEAIKRGDAEAAVAELTAHYAKVVALQRRFIREAKEQSAGR